MDEIKEPKDRLGTRFTVLMTRYEKYRFFKTCRDNKITPSEAVRAFCAEYSRG